MALRDRGSVEQVIEALRRNPPRDADHLTRIYRRVLKQTHPDSAGGDATLFLFAQESFGRYRVEWESVRHRSVLTDGMDPWYVIRDLGLPETLLPRQALYAALYRFRALGLTSWRVRSRPALRERNLRVVRTVIHWAYETDPTFVPLFEDFLKYQGQFAIGEREAPLFFMIRRMALRALDWLIRYHDRGRPAAGAIGRDTLAYAIMLCEAHRNHRSFAAMEALMRWMDGEFLLEPALVGLDL